ncbi:phosphate transporter PHO1 homolog 9-like [Juglans microcarpa x Juglans regia]|uniref:phosphate transporter PHO1 homolog 9-like n=1 Tax=Juglans microcarpa x Juglans regia TaxID=2249226 RepID=UPI001B7F6A0F|nr:phosphate transporter PHO1 homolog 9-like [Juglans microcarpa x Juglans regia]
MKFGKEFESQMVQEWQKAYMDYNGLKTVLKDILRFKQGNASTPESSTARGSLKRRMSLYRAFSGLNNRYRNSPRKNDDEVILVDEVQQDGSELGPYQTTFLKPCEIGGECEPVFFRRLDDEFNKVISFYKGKVEEMIEEANELSKQMDALIALRMKVHNPMMKFDKAALEKLTSNSSTGTKSGSMHMNVIQEVEMSGERHMDDEIQETVETSGVHKRGKVVSIQGFRPASLEVLDHVKLNITPETPVSTLKKILTSDVALSFTKKELRKAEERMIQAFIEFYRKLQLLKRYCFLNLLAFSKIMKKYDKIASRKASKTYMELVENSYLGSSDEVSKLMERVEVTFIERFANGNHRKGLKILRPKTKREKHRITFSLGFFSGCSLAFVAAIVVLVHARGILRSQGRDRYMENIFPLYTLFGFIVLHMLMYSANIFFWRHYRVNYSFIFGFKQGTELGYREVFLLSSGLAVLAFACVISNLDMEMDPGGSIFRVLTELVPLGLLTVVILITICPLNIIYRSSRFFLLRCAFRCLCAPLYKVTLPDFFLADQLTSQVPAIRSLQFYVCYYGWGYFRKNSNNGCRGSDVYQAFYFIVAIIPYWSRLIQCLRRLVEEKDVMHGLNGLKYFSIVVALVMKTGNELKMGMMTWKIMAIVSSAVATIFATYWDLVIDWGLLRRNSINPWLRDKLLVPNRGVYVVAMVMNVLLRLAWMQSVLGLTETPVLHRQALIAIVACLEIIRRGIWNFFRLENEHLNNVGKYRAFKSVPLPFNYDNDEDRDD